LSDFEAVIFIVIVAALVAVASSIAPFAKRLD
jgi:hypothetical protein